MGGRHESGGSPASCRSEAPVGAGRKARRRYHWVRPTIIVEAGRRASRSGRCPTPGEDLDFARLIEQRSSLLQRWTLALSEAQ